MKKFSIIFSCLIFVVNIAFPYQADLGNPNQNNENKQIQQAINIRPNDTEKDIKLQKQYPQYFSDQKSHILSENDRQAMLYQLHQNYKKK